MARLPVAMLRVPGLLDGSIHLKSYPDMPQDALEQEILKRSAELCSRLIPKIN